MTITLRSSDDETFVVEEEVALCVRRRARIRECAPFATASASARRC